MNTTTTSTTDYYQLVSICPYSTCIDKGKKCDTCAHNPNQSFYEPIPCYPWHPTPYIPYTYPCYIGDPPYPTTIIWS